MTKDSMDRLTHEVGKLTGVMEGVIKSNDHNTAEIKIFNAYMNKSSGAQEERDKHYKRVKHTSIGAIIMSLCAAIKTFALGH